MKKINNFNNFKHFLFIYDWGKYQKAFLLLLLFIAFY